MDEKLGPGTGEPRPITGGRQHGFFANEDGLKLGLQRVKGSKEFRPKQQRKVGNGKEKRLSPIGEVAARLKLIEIGMEYGKQVAETVDGAVQINDVRAHSTVLSSVGESGGAVVRQEKRKHVPLPPLSPEAQRLWTDLKANGSLEIGRKHGKPLVLKYPSGFEGDSKYSADAIPSSVGSAEVQPQIDRTHASFYGSPLGMDPLGKYDFTYNRHEIGELVVQSCGCKFQVREVKFPSGSAKVGVCYEMCQAHFQEPR